MMKYQLTPVHSTKYFLVMVFEHKSTVSRSKGHLSLSFLLNIPLKKWIMLNGKKHILFDLKVLI